MSDSQHDQKREFYRLRYPEAARPAIQVGGQHGEVEELSESGARVRIPGRTVPAGERLSGIVRFADNDMIPIAGEVLRTEGDVTVLHLTAGVSLKRMIAEQKRLLKEYPWLFDKEGSNDG